MLRSAILAALLLATPAVAQEAAEPPCLPRAEWLKITAQLGQYLRSQGETSVAERPVLLTINPETGNWALFVDMGDGTACLFAEN